MRIVVFTIAVVAAFSESAPAVAGPPSIVLILADDLGYGDLGCYGQTRIQTPCLDRMAREGMRFLQCYAGSTVCAPSRCSLLTGMQMGHAAIRGNREVQPEGQMPLPADTLTVPRMLKDAGYRTGCFGKWGLGMVGSTGDPNRHGFDEFFGYVCQRKAHNYYPEYLWRNGRRVELDSNRNGAQGTYSHDLIVEESLKFLRSQDAERPFFLYVPFTIPHLALQVPEDSLAAYRGRWPETPYDGKRGYRPHPMPRAAYAAMVSRMDRDIGRLTDLLEERKLDRNTIVLFSSDNGATFNVGGADTTFFAGNGPLRGRKQDLYEGGIRVPMIVKWPGRIEAGSTCDQPCAFWDFLPTVSELIGRAPPLCDGVSILPMWLANKPVVRPVPYFYWEAHDGPSKQAVRFGNWKAIRNAIGRPLELYDLVSDVGETTDVAKGNPRIVEQAEAYLKDARTESPQWPLKPPTAK